MLQLREFERVILYFYAIRLVLLPLSGLFQYLMELFKYNPTVLICEVKLRLQILSHLFRGKMYGALLL